MAAKYPTLNELAAQINRNAAALTGYFEEHNLEMPGLSPTSIALYPHDPAVLGARSALMQAAKDLYQLAMGTDEYMKIMGFTDKHDLMALEVLTEFDVFTTVPLPTSSEPNASISLAELASKTNLPEDVLRRLLRHLAPLRIFSETSPGSDQIIHTGASAAHARNPIGKAAVGHHLSEVGRGCYRMADALQMYGDAGGDPSRAGWAVAFGLQPGKTAFDFMAEDGRDLEPGEEPERDGEWERKTRGWRMRRFGQVMSGVTKDPAFNVAYVHQGFDWDGLPQGAVVVDIGGSTGHASFDLAGKHPQITCVVQDLPGLEAQFNATCPADLKSRVTFQAHDFFTPEPVKDADIYFMKWILHDWSDEWAQKIIRNIVPAMKLGKSRFLIVEHILPPPGVLPFSLERLVTTTDMQMMVACWSKERSEEDWHKLFHGADPRLRVKSAVRPPGAGLGVIEVVFEE